MIRGGLTSLSVLLPGMLLCNAAAFSIWDLSLADSASDSQQAPRALKLAFLAEATACPTASAPYPSTDGPITPPLDPFARPPPLYAATASAAPPLDPGPAVGILVRFPMVPGFQF